MAEFPALPLWTDAYLGDTTHLTTIEHGAYFLLLVTAWRADGTRLPDDDRKLARYARLGPQQWARMKPTIADFFVIENGWWTQRRLTDEAVAVRQHRERQSAKGKASSLKRKGRHGTGVKSGSAPVTTEPQPEGNLPYSYSNSVGKPTGADAPQIDPIKLLFDTGLKVLTAAGVSPSSARSAVGRWRKARNDDWTLQALNAAQKEGVSDPIAWIEGRLRRDREGNEARDAYNKFIIDQARQMRAAEEAK